MLKTAYNLIALLGAMLELLSSGLALILSIFQLFFPSRHEQQAADLADLKAENLKLRNYRQFEQWKQDQNRTLIGDLQVEKLKAQNALLDAKLKAAGIGLPEFKANDYPDPGFATENNRSLS